MKLQFAWAKFRSMSANDMISYNFPWPRMKTNSEALKYTHTLFLAWNGKFNKNSGLKQLEITTHLEKVETSTYNHWELYMPKWQYLVNIAK